MRQMSEAVDNTNSGTDRAEGRCPINDRVENNLDFLMKHQHHGRTSPHIETIENLSSQYDVYKQDKKKNHKPHFKRGLRKMFKTKSQKKVVETSSA
eukprot:CAMPEP_0172520114 /NCGR_PEP_ID=MMETSP1066-20121228/291814_1 /TAXON_ID=671091 /ORGANISM="Coscinodiscus wailesii, Strain CCMP2513" /LENGTH=95 /DNA_ID=CAMNT_0013302817 /DNA_START=192 /DNA_END=482 /DNA_ORIENTATION=-